MYITLITIILFDLIKLNSLLAFHISSLSMNDLKINIPVHSVPSAHQDNSQQNEFGSLIIILNSII